MGASRFSNSIRGVRRCVSHYDAVRRLVAMKYNQPAVHVSMRVNRSCRQAAQAGSPHGHIYMQYERLNS